MGKGMRPAQFQDHNKIGNEMERIKENEKKNPTIKHKEPDKDNGVTKTWKY